VVLLITRSAEVVSHRRIGGATKREKHTAEDHRDEAGDCEVARLTNDRVAAEAHHDHEQHEDQQDTAHVEGTLAPKAPESEHGAGWTRTSDQGIMSPVL
jgi:hypothetical protein